MLIIRHSQGGFIRRGIMSTTIKEEIVRMEKQLAESHRRFHVSTHKGSHVFGYGLIPFQTGRYNERCRMRSSKSYYGDPRNGADVERPANIWCSAYNVRHVFIHSLDLSKLPLSEAIVSA